MIVASQCQHDIKVLGNLLEANNTTVMRNASWANLAKIHVACILLNEIDLHAGNLLVYEVKGQQYLIKIDHDASFAKLWNGQGLPETANYQRGAWTLATEISAVGLHKLPLVNEHCHYNFFPFSFLRLNQQYPSADHAIVLIHPDGYITDLVARLRPRRQNYCYSQTEYQCYYETFNDITTGAYSTNYLQEKWYAVLKFCSFPAKCLMDIATIAVSNAYQDHVLPIALKQIIEKCLINAYTLVSGKQQELWRAANELEVFREYLRTSKRLAITKIRKELNQQEAGFQKNLLKMGDTPYSLTNTVLAQAERLN